MCMRSSLKWYAQAHQHATLILLYFGNLATCIRANETHCRRQPYQLTQVQVFTVHVFASSAKACWYLTGTFQTLPNFLKCSLTYIIMNLMFYPRDPGAELRYQCM
jgi:hypothetical protein